MILKKSSLKNRKSILIVDDLISNVKLLAKHLDEYKLYFALDGLTAFSVAEESIPDVILLDVMMPGIDGYELCRRLKQNSTTSSIPVIFVTAKSHEDDEELGLQVGAIDFISKPINGPILRARLANHLELKEYRDNLEELLIKKDAELSLTYDQLLHAEKLSAIGKLTASISHEFSSPLLGMEQILKAFKLEEEDHEKKQLFNVCISECQRLRDLIREMQNFGRPTSSSFEPVDLNNIVSGVIKLCAKNLSKRNIQSELQLADIPKINGIKDQMKQVLFNLLTNAADSFADTGGNITIQTKIVDKWVVLTVTDTGCGIAEDNLDDVFAPFFSTKAEGEGTGLGLSICYGIVSKHKGRINVESTYGKGATFTLRFPIIEE